MRLKFVAMAGAGILAGTGAFFTLAGEDVSSADHIDPPQRTDPAVDGTPDRAADLADIFAFAEDGNLNLVATFAGPAPTENPAVYDRDVLYVFNVSTDGDSTTTEERILIRFGSEGANNFGVRVEGIPGIGTIEGPVETTLQQDDAQVLAGLFDDPFFFDSQGFRETLQTGDLRITSSRDTFSNQNITAIVLQIPLDNFNATGALAVWSETKRFGGQL